MDKAQLHHMLALRRSIQQNIPYEYAKNGGSIFRSGDVRPAVSFQARQGGFAPAMLAPLLPIVAPIAAKVLERPITKLTDKLFGWMGLGNGAAYRVGGTKRPHDPFWHRVGDIGIHVPPVRNAQNAAMGGFGPLSGILGMLGMGRREMKYLKILESRLKPLAANPDAFVSKLRKIHAAGDGWFKKHGRRMKASKISKMHAAGKRKYHYSKRYGRAKAKFGAAYPGEKYFGSSKYIKHKAAYKAHRNQKKSS